MERVPVGKYVCVSCYNTVRACEDPKLWATRYVAGCSGKRNGWVEIVGLRIPNVSHHSLVTTTGRWLND
jgi:hypothetical protein